MASGRRRGRHPAGARRTGEGGGYHGDLSEVLGVGPGGKRRGLDGREGTVPDGERASMDSPDGEGSAPGGHEAERR